jgi:SSS family transporter
MSTADWIVLGFALLAMTAYGIWRGRGSRSVESFLLADRSLGWGTVALSIMATQASAITFTSTPGQAFADGMRFLQFYFGLPLAMVILSITAVPKFHRLGVYSAYEYLEHRFDAKMRLLGTALFLLSRGLATGMTIYAPSLVLSVMLNVDVRITSVIIGGIVIIVTATGGVKAVNHTHVLQLSIIMAGMLAAGGVLLALLPDGVSVTDALSLAGATGKLNTIDFRFDLENRYTFWSGLIGGMFVALAYFGTDQSQVQRYLTGKSIAQSRLALLFNGVAKVPMQFFMLLLGVLVYVFFLFAEPPLFFNPAAAAELKATEHGEAFEALEGEFRQAVGQRREAAEGFVRARHEGASGSLSDARSLLVSADQAVENLRRDASAMIGAYLPAADSSDTNYIFLTFVLTYLPVGLIGLIFACIFAASLSSSSGELSALATISIIDVYRRFVRRDATDRHYLHASRLFMALWGLYGIAFAQYASRLGSLIEAVNILGSLFYGTMLGIFLLAFYGRSVGGTATFSGAIAGEVVVVTCFLWTPIAWLWYNVIGCAVVVGVALLWTVTTQGREPSSRASEGRI